MRRINLLPQDLQPPGTARPPTARLIRTLGRSPIVLGAVGVIGALSAGGLWQGAVLWRYQHGLGPLRQELASLQGTSVQLKTLQQALHVQRAGLLVKRDALEQRRQVLASARQPAVPVSTVLADLAKTFPDEVWLTKLTLADETLKIVGASRDTQSVTTLLDRLEDSRRFRDTQFARTERAAQAADAAFSFEVSTRPVFQEPGAS